MICKPLALLFLGATIFLSGCAAHRLPNYSFSVTGIVATESGSPIEDAEITLELSRPVYEVALPVKTVGRLTNASGSFAFTYTTHEQGIGYVITVSKDGFETQTVKGSAPPAAYHAILLKKTTSKSVTRARDLLYQLMARRS